MGVRVSDRTGEAGGSHRWLLTFVVGGLVILVALIGLLLFVGRYGVKPDFFTPIESLQPTFDVSYADGSEVFHGEGDFGLVHKGDRVSMRATLSRIHGNQELYIPLYNAIVDVYLDGEALFLDSYNPNDLADHYGNRLYEVPLPERTAPSELLVEVRAVESLSRRELMNMGLARAGDGWKFILEGKVGIFTLFLVLIVLASVSTVAFAVQGIMQRKVPLGLPVALFELVLTSWYFGVLHMFNLIVEDPELCAKAEYFALYLIPLPLALFIYKAIGESRLRRAVIWAFWAYFAYYVVVTGIELSTIQLNYSDMTSSMHPIAGTVLIVLVAALFGGMQDDREDDGAGPVFILRAGAVVSVICGMAELGRYALMKVTPWRSPLVVNGLSLIAVAVILSFTIAVVTYLIETSRAEFALRIERAKLMELAYKDQLTGLPNRAECHRRIDRMEADDVHDYTMAFIDLNNLKDANDRFGHNTGDELLRSIARVIESVFGEHGFCARWGGDEFVACVFGPPELGERLIAEFEQRLDEADRTSGLPVKLSAACGSVVSTADDPRNPTEALRGADSAMYEKKKRAKQGRDAAGEGESVDAAGSSADGASADAADASVADRGPDGAEAGASS